MTLPLQKSHALAAVLAGLVLAASAITTALGFRDLPAPFIWLDVAAVYIIAALPLLATLATAATLQFPLSSSTLILVLVEIATLFLVPRLYIHARCQRDVREAIQLSRDSRYGEASELLHRVLALEPDAEWNGNPVALASRNMAEIVNRIEQRLAEPLPESSTADQCVDRAQSLAILGRRGEALALLDSRALENLPQAHNLRGLIHETPGHWQAARQSYERGKAAWQSQPESADRSGGLAQATRGIAFCERKLGHLRQAEAAWQQLLALSPTADTHLLLAQFYEDTQQTSKAQFHAQQAIQLAPSNNVIQNQARQLQTKLVTSHFGCLGAFISTDYPASPNSTNLPLSK